LRRYGHLKFFQDGGRRRHLGLFCSNRKQRNSTRRSRKPHPRTKHEVYRITRWGDMAIRVSWRHIPHFGGRKCRRVSAMEPFERATVVSYIALHRDRCTICNHSAVICDRMSPTLKSTGGGSLWAQISGCSPWSKP